MAHVIVPSAKGGEKIIERDVFEKEGRKYVQYKGKMRQVEQKGGQWIVVGSDWKTLSQPKKQKKGRIL